MKNVEDIYVLSVEQHDVLTRTADGLTSGRYTSSVIADLTFNRDLPEPGAWLDQWNESWSRVLQRHTVLRTLFVLDEKGHAAQQVVRQRVESPWRLHDLTVLAPAEREREAGALAEAACHESFDLERAPLARGTLLIIDARTVRLIFVYHPLILDRESAAAVIAELLATHASLSRGSRLEVNEARPFRDYLAWTQSQGTPRSASFWNERLQGKDQGARLVGLRSAGASPTWSKHRIDLAPDVREQLMSLARAAGESAFAIVAAGWALLLERRNGSSSLFGIEVSARADVSSSSQTMLGPFTRTVPLCPGLLNTAAPVEVIRRLTEDRQEACRHSYISLTQMLGARELTSTVRGPPPSLLAPEGIKIGAVQWCAPSRTPLVIEPADPNLAAIDLWFDRERLDIDHAIAIGVGLRERLEDLAPGRRSIEITREQVDLAAIERLLKRHPSVHAARVSMEPGDKGSDRIVVRVKPTTRRAGERPIQFSLFYFADADSADGTDKYRLYLESAREADRRGFTAVWTPERHFHENGGLYPSPSVLSGALATVTERIGLRAGSVVLPLHHTLRVAEEWAVVDNLSGGRVGLSFASGWVPNDFAFFPEKYADKRTHLFRQIEELEKLWAGGKIPARDGMGNDYEVGVFPRPIQRTLPIWITCSGDPAVFVQAAQLRHKALTALITLSFEEVAQRIRLYRDKVLEVSGGTDRGHVTLMIHAFVGENEQATREQVRPALSKFLGSHVGLVKTAVQSAHASLVAEEEQLVSFAFEKYYRAASLLGSQEKCASMVERLRGIGVDELACLIDFGLEREVVLGGLSRLAELKDHFDRRQTRDAGDTLTTAELQRYLCSHLPDGGPPATIRISDDTTV